jgi:hypothetical protein
MRHTTHTTQVVGLFGGGYVHEAHGRGLGFDEPKKPSRAKWTVVLAALVIGATTAGASIRSVAPEVHQAGIFHYPGSIGLQQLLF